MKSNIKSMQLGIAFVLACLCIAVLLTGCGDEDMDVPLVTAMIDSSTPAAPNINTSRHLCAPN